MAHSRCVVAVEAVVLCLWAAAALPATNVAAEKLRAPAVDAAVDVGRADGSTLIEDAVLWVPRSDEATVRLQLFLEDQQDPSSPQYHQWLTPEEFAAQFGPRESEIAALVASMRGAGIQTTVARSRGWIRLSGRAAQFEKAFGHEVRQMRAGSQTRFRMSEATVAREAPLAGWSRRLFLPGQLYGHSSARRIAPEYTTALNQHALAPGDYVTVYNIQPIYDAGYRGSNAAGTITIAVAGQSEVNLADVQLFRKTFGLPANDPTITHVGASPGTTGDELEGAIDLEWAGAIAPLANIRYYVARSVGDASLHAIDENAASVLTVSYGLCEDQDAAEAPFYQHMWQQAAAQGMSVFVSSGDSGAAGCDPISATVGTNAGVNLFCTPEVTCVGGTQFDDTGKTSTYWSASNAGNLSSVKSYIPEIAWNESGGSNGLASSGGGTSTIFTRPSYQNTAGVPSGSMRCQPDIAANAGHVAYLAFYHGNIGFVIGTSIGTPAVAGTIALFNERFGRLGNFNSTLYQLANAQYSGTGPAVFHDVTSGTNSVPGVTGFSCGTGYDLVTGLGSIDAGALMNAMAPKTPPRRRAARH